MLCSISRKGDCWDDASMETFLGSMKTKMEGNAVFKTRNEAKAAIFSFIEVSYKPADIRPLAIVHPLLWNGPERPRKPQPVSILPGEGQSANVPMPAPAAPVGGRVPPGPLLPVVAAGG